MIRDEVIHTIEFDDMISEILKSEESLFCSHQCLSKDMDTKVSEYAYFSHFLFCYELILFPISESTCKELIRRNRDDFIKRFFFFGFSSFLSFLCFIHEYKSLSIGIR